MTKYSGSRFEWESRTMKKIKKKLYKAYKKSSQLELKVEYCPELIGNC